MKTMNNAELQSFYDIYPECAEIYKVNFNLEAVRAVYGHRADWDTIRMMLVGGDNTDT